MSDTNNTPSNTSTAPAPASAAPQNEQLSAAEWMIQELHRRVQQGLPSAPPLSPAPEKN
jgi:hypothetical protein